MMIKKTALADLCLGNHSMKAANATSGGRADQCQRTIFCGTWTSTRGTQPINFFMPTHPITPNACDCALASTTGVDICCQPISPRLFPSACLRIQLLSFSLDLPNSASYKGRSEPTLFSLLENSDEAHSPGEHPLSPCLNPFLTCLFLL